MPALFFDAMPCRCRQMLFAFRYALSPLPYDCFVQPRLYHTGDILPYGTYVTACRCATLITLFIDAIYVIAVTSLMFFGFFYAML